MRMMTGSPYQRKNKLCLRIDGAVYGSDDGSPDDVSVIAAVVDSTEDSGGAVGGSVGAVKDSGGTVGDSGGIVVSGGVVGTIAPGFHCA